MDDGYDWLWAIGSAMAHGLGIEIPHASRADEPEGLRFLEELESKFKKINEVLNEPKDS